MASFGAGLLGVSAAFAQQDIVTFSSINPNDTFNNGGSYTLGYEFDVTTPITVTGLSVFNATPGTGLNVNTPVGLWNASQTEIASATVLAGIADPLTSDGFFRYATLSTPVTLPDGTYYVGAVSTARSGKYTDDVNGLAAISGITFVGSAENNGTGLLAFPELEGPGTNGIFGGNVVVGATPVPEPEFSKLLWMGLAGLGAFGLKKLL
jgi:hypothetical protein